MYINTSTNTAAPHTCHVACFSFFAIDTRQTVNSVTHLQNPSTDLQVYGVTNEQRPAYTQTGATASTVVYSL